MVWSIGRPIVRHDDARESLSDMIAPAMLGGCITTGASAVGGRRARALRMAAGEIGRFAGMPTMRCAEEFAIGLAQLRGIAAAGRCVVMCSEALWWRCIAGWSPTACSSPARRLSHRFERAGLRHRLTPFATVGPDARSHTPTHRPAGPRPSRSETRPLSAARRGLRDPRGRRSNLRDGLACPRPAASASRPASSSST